MTMKHQLKYLKLFEGLSPSEIPYSDVWGVGTMNIDIPEDVSELPEIYNELTDEVTGSLSIDNNESLTEVTGFNNLTRVGNHLSIEDNESLTEVTGFNNLTEVGWYITIEGNESLTSVTGFDKLTYMGAGLYIQNNPKLVAMSIPGSILRSVNYLEYGIVYDDLEFNSPPEFINSPEVIDDLMKKFNPGYHNTQVINQIIKNLEEWGTQDTKDKVYSHLGQYLTPEQWELVPTHIQHLYHPDYKSTSGRDVAKLNTGQIYGIF